MHDLAVNTDGAVRRGRGSVWIRSFVGMSWFAAEVMITSGARAYFGGSQVGGVAFDPEDHVDGNESNGGFRMDGTIVDNSLVARCCSHKVLAARV